MAIHLCSLPSLCWKHKKRHSELGNATRRPNTRAQHIEARKATLRNWGHKRNPDTRSQSIETRETTHIIWEHKRNPETRAQSIETEGSNPVGSRSCHKGKTPHGFNVTHYCMLPACMRTLHAPRTCSTTTQEYDTIIVPRWYQNTSDTIPATCLSPQARAMHPLKRGPCMGSTM